MRKQFALASFVLVTLFLSACSGATEELSPTETPSTVLGQSATPETLDEFVSPEASELLVPLWPENQMQEDNQGAVTVAITPTNLNRAEETLNFQVVLNTHSVELGMDLAQLATLATSTGISVDAELWDAPLGGHHVDGVLSFPALLDGLPIMDGATELTLIIRDVDAAERVFHWQQ
jgi:hypothetical protein